MSSESTKANLLCVSTTQTKKAPINPSIFDALSDSSFVRESQLVQSPQRPGIPAPLPFSAPTLWRKVKAGTFPKPIKLSQRVTAWQVGSVRAWIAAQTLECGAYSLDQLRTIDKKLEPRATEIGLTSPAINQSVPTTNKE